jgi:hypothetical protein
VSSRVATTSRSRPPPPGISTVEAEGFEALTAGVDHTAARGLRLDTGWDAIQELPALDRRP